MNNHPFPSVSHAEVAYAATAFMAAADNRLHSSFGFSVEQEFRCAKVYSDLIDSSPEHGRSPNLSSTGSLLYGVFRQLWAIYAPELEPEPICGRILAFHLLMERTHGAAIEGWTSLIEDREGEVTLHPAVIDAIGSVRFCPADGFDEKEFEAEILLHALPQ